MYKVVVKFADVMDRDHIYEIGDTYPREGYEPDADRVEFLASSQNKLGAPVIELVLEKKSKKEEETPKKRTGKKTSK